MHPPRRLLEPRHSTNVPCARLAMPHASHLAALALTFHRHSLEGILIVNTSCTLHLDLVGTTGNRCRQSCNSIFAGTIYPVATRILPVLAGACLLLTGLTYQFEDWSIRGSSRFFAAAKCN